jgi:hypothetical protein
MPGMQPNEYTKLALDNFDFSTPGAFYGAAGGRALGSGLIYGGIIFPLHNNETGTFDSAEGAVYVLTHECDVDQTNVRHFNHLVVVCPIIPLESLVAEYEAAFGEEQLKGLLVHAARNEVFRLLFLPPPPRLLGVQDFPYGAMMYMNHICSTHVSGFAYGQARPICAVSERGLERIDWKFQNLLFRPKADTLPQLS